MSKQLNKKKLNPRRGRNKQLQETVKSIGWDGGRGIANQSREIKGQ
jgi:hypothetical protein